MKKFQYLATFIVPATLLIGIHKLSYFVYITPIFSFILIPVLELFTHSEEQSSMKKGSIDYSKDSFFDILLWINIPLIIYILFSVLEASKNNLSLSESIGLTISLGIVLSSNAINVGHELGHRKGTEKYLGKLLLLPTLYMHFFIEHNYGHHNRVATKEDPVTAQYNQPIYQFWFSSIYGQYISAWQIQKKLLRQKGKKFISIHNDMLCYLLLQSLYLFFIYYRYTISGILVVFIAAIISILLLETINYVEHYALVRIKKKNGRYERILPIHSWNSNHLLGRIMLYEITRHSDHHHRTSKKYQVLEHHDSSPQLPYGYPTSMLIALIPPLWFHIMNKHVPNSMKPIDKKNME
ncbi:alkane 1-monooxygenase [Aquimarina sp. TRL1]|uniref:alkane 1-monooxygenase n=1 Tax=Aquimarina sp. (strain TRL1) TaxID=2736252 RepID=UPI00158B2A9E|nr:alkane 1-monooxygenase [Aquimarina sp. TRL1]QKX04686.1 alkane 1-monooxygenase [Aquimarina sp. TRL1]